MASEYPSEFSTIVGDYGAPGAQASQPRLNVMRMLKLRWPGMLIVFIIFAIPAATVAWFFVPAQYTAVATLRFLSVQPRILANSEILTIPYNTFVNTQVNALMDYEILEKVLMEPSVRALPIVMEQKSPLEFLKKKIFARHQPGTELVRVMCILPERDATKTIVDALTKVYLQVARSSDADAGGQRMKTLNDNKLQLERELVNITNKTISLQQALGIPIKYIENMTPSETTQYREQIAEAERTLNQATSQMETTKRALDEAQLAKADYARDRSAVIFKFDIENAVAAEPGVASLRSSLAQAETELALSEERFKENNPQLQVLRKNIDTLKTRLASLEQRARGDALDSFIARKQIEYDDTTRVAELARELRDDFQEKLEQHEGTLENAANTLTEYQNLLRDQDEKLRRLAEINSQINTIRIEESAPARVQPASPAVVPPDPDYGKKLQFTLLGIIGAGGMGVMFGLWRELSDQQIRSPQDVTTMTSIPLIAAIPHLSEDRLPADVHSPLLILDHPNSPTADEFRRILVRLLYPAEGATEINSCLVTSPTRGDGKTSMACNLAVALAEADRRVLLLDISSREASIERCFHLEEGPGLCDILCGSGSLMEYIRPVSVPNLHILGPGFGDGDLAGRLASRELLELIEEAEHEFEHVIIDSPPSLLMADARLLAPVVDGVVVVVGAGVSTVGMLRRCLRELDQVGATVVGIALNRLRSTRTGYFRSNYDLYYNYSVDRQKDWEPRDVPEMQVFESDDVNVEPELILLDHEADDREPDESKEPRGATRT